MHTKVRANIKSKSVCFKTVLTFLFTFKVNCSTSALSAHKHFIHLVYFFFTCSSYTLYIFYTHTFILFSSCHSQSPFLCSQTVYLLFVLQPHCLYFILLFIFYTTVCLFLLRFSFPYFILRFILLSTFYICIFLSFKHSVLSFLSFHITYLG